MKLLLFTLLVSMATRPGLRIKVVGLRQEDEAGGLYHALNRGNSRAKILCKAVDHEAFGKILGDRLAHNRGRYPNAPVSTRCRPTSLCAATD